MNNKTIVEFGFRIIWRIMEISEGIIRPGWLKSSLISIILQMILNLTHFDITMDILHTFLHTLPKVLMRRICWTIQNFYTYWSFLLFSQPLWLFEQDHYREKLAIGHPWKLKS